MEDKYRNLLKRREDAVLEEFKNIMYGYDSEIERSLERIEIHLSDKSLDNDGKLDMKLKRARDHDLKGERTHLGITMEKRNGFLINSNMFKIDINQWDAEEAVKVCLLAFMKVTKPILNQKQLKKWEKAMEGLEGKDIEELRGV